MPIEDSARFIYPPAKIERSQSEFGGVTFVDPYKWLEERSPETDAWVEAQNRLTSRVLADIPVAEFVLSSLSRHDVPRPDQLPKYIAGTWFWTATHPESKRPVVYAGSRLATDGRILFDATDLESPVPVITWISPSPDGSILALGLCEDGSENNRIVLVEVETGSVLPPATNIMLMDNWTGGVHWHPTGKGFFFTGILYRAVDAEFAVFFHDHLAGTTERVDVDWLDNTDYRGVFITPGTMWAVAVQGLCDPVPVAVLDLSTPHSRWRRFVRDEEGPVAGQVFGDDYFAVTSVGADRGRIVKIPLGGDGSRETWKEVVAETDVVLRTIVPAGDRFYVTLFKDTYSGIRVYDLSGELIGDVGLPPSGRQRRDLRAGPANSDSSLSGFSA